MWKTIETPCLNCGRNVHARPVKKPYKPTKNIDWTPMEYSCECGNVDILNDYGNYRLWQSSQDFSGRMGGNNGTNSNKKNQHRFMSLLPCL